MAWSKRSENGYTVAEETITLPSSSPVSYTSVIDWIKPGQDFIVLANAAETSLSEDTGVDVYVCDTSDGTFVKLKDDLIAEINDVTAVALYDVSSMGEAPYYKIATAPDGIQDSGDTIKFVVMTRTAYASRVAVG